MRNGGLFWESAYKESEGSQAKAAMVGLDQR